MAFINLTEVLAEVEQIIGYRSVPGALVRLRYAIPCELRKQINQYIKNIISNRRLSQRTVDLYRIPNAPSLYQRIHRQYSQQKTFFHSISCVLDAE